VTDDIPAAEEAAPGEPEWHRTCPKCGSPLSDQQEWCLECGARISLHRHRVGGFGAANVLVGLAAALAIAAVVLAYDAANKSTRTTTTQLVAASHPLTTPATTAPTTTTIISTSAPTTTVPAPVVTTPIVSTPTATTPTSSSTAITPSVTSSDTSTSTSTPTTTTTTSAGSTTSASTTGTGTTTLATGTGTGSTTTGTGTTGTGTTGSTGTTGTGTTTTGIAPALSPGQIAIPPTAISIYNPYSYPAADFGDPTLAVDGSRATVWTAATSATHYPNMVVGLLVDLGTAQSTKYATLATSTPGMTVELYGANGAVPPSISSGWTPMGKVKKAKPISVIYIAKAEKAKTFRYILFWIPRAPAVAPGTPPPPDVTVQELQLHGPSGA
jgi:predicted nucleic acid-binding Zn ribbon protein